MGAKTMLRSSLWTRRIEAREFVQKQCTRCLSVLATTTATRVIALGWLFDHVDLDAYLRVLNHSPLSWSAANREREGRPPKRADKDSTESASFVLKPSFDRA